MTVLPSCAQSENSLRLLQVHVPGQEILKMFVVSWAAVLRCVVETFGSEGNRWKTFYSSKKMILLPN